MTERFKVGDRVTWKSAAAGTWRTKAGEVIEVVPARKRPKTYHALPRMDDGESYIVRAVAKGRGAPEKAQVYWPRASKLRRAPGGAT